MERNYKLGDIVRIEMKNGVFQIVGKKDESQVYVRRIFDSKLNFRLGKAELYHITWLHGVSKVYMQKIEQILKDENEIASQIKNVCLDPTFNYYTWFFSKKYTPFFIVNDENISEINKRIADEYEKNPQEKQLLKTLHSLQKKKLVLPVKTRLINGRQGLKETESVYRVECGRYETDFDQNGNMNYSKARLYKIKNMGVSKIKADYDSPIGWFVSE